MGGELGDTVVIVPRAGTAACDVLQADAEEEDDAGVKDGASTELATAMLMLYG